MKSDQTGAGRLYNSHTPEPDPTDAVGDQAAQDPRLLAQLQIVSRSLSQFSMAINGIRLTFWGEEPNSVSREIFIEHDTLELAQPVRPSSACPPLLLP